jgi:hypothetical protein
MNPFVLFFRCILASVLLLMLSGCFESRLNTGGLCDNNPSLECEKLNLNDGKCKVQRTDLIWHRYDMLKNPDDLKLIEEYEMLADYQQCLTLAAQIRALKTTAQTQNRFNALQYSYNEQKRLFTVMQEIDNPYIYYFLWTHGDDFAKRKFLQLEPTGQLNTPTLQYYLATYYSNRDPEHTLSILNKALDLTGKNEVDKRIIQSLASIHQTAGHREMSYLWAIVGRSFKLPVSSDRDLAVFYSFNESQKEYLDQKAAEIVSHLQQGTYNSTLLPSQSVVQQL